MYCRALHCKKRCYLVSGGLSLPCDPLRCDGFLQSHNKRRRKSDKSVSTPKLSALQHRCLRFLLLLKWYNDCCEQRYNIVLNQRWFFKYGANPRRAQINKRHPHLFWIIHVQRKPSNQRGKSACRPKHSIYLSNCWCKALSCPVSLLELTLSSLLRLSPPPPCPLSVFKELCVLMWMKTLFSSRLICVLSLGRHNDPLSCRLSAVCSWSVTTHPLNRMRNCGESCLPSIFCQVKSSRTLCS